MGVSGQVTRRAALVTSLVTAAALGPSAAVAVTTPAAPIQATTAAPSPTPAPAPTLRTWRPGIEAAQRFAATRPGRVRWAVLDQTTGRRWNYRAHEQVSGLSLLKTLLVVTYLRRGAVQDAPLTARARRLLPPMIRRSANGPATELVGQLGPAAIARAGRAAGMGRVHVVRPWGTTQTTAASQVALFSRLPGLIPARHRDYAMGLLGSIVPSQRWGIGAVQLPAGWKLYLKGGWGSGTGLADHQTGLLVRAADPVAGRPQQRVVLSITTTGHPSHERAKATLRGVAARLLAGLPG
ncbi:MAG: hypothetical protein J7513_12190 [Solirubrobacteraceae bacterium]|nr:hypothetical protein [Solirubrobacteraceae bacterium]